MYINNKNQNVTEIYKRKQYKQIILFNKIYLLTYTSTISYNM